MGQKHFGRVNKGFSYKKMYGGFCQAAKGSGGNNEVTVLPRWPQGGVSL